MSAHGKIERASSAGPSRVALLNPSGWGNLGDAAIIDSLIAGVRRRRPGVEILGFTLNPEDTKARHAIPAHTLAGFSLRYYAVQQDQATGGNPAVDSAVSVPPPFPSISGRLRRLASHLPGLRLLYRLLLSARAEFGHLRRSKALLQGVDTFVVAGGGQLDDHWGGPFGHPYVLQRWARLARRGGARFLVLSVGTGSLVGPLSRFFVRRALSGADYVSFRDEGSRRLAEGAGDVAGAPIVPDLAFAVPHPTSTTGVPRAGRVIGISPMAFLAPHRSEEDRRTFRRYLELLASLVRLVLEDGHTVALFATEGMDERTILQLVDVLEPSLAATVRQRLLRPPITGLDSLFRLLDGLEVVVASRLHGVLLSHVAGLPCVAIPHERKVTAHMRDMGQERFCLEFASFDPQAGMGVLTDMLRSREAVAREVRDEVARRCLLVEQQYDRLFGVTKKA